MPTEQLTEPAIQATPDGAPKNDGSFMNPDFEKRFQEAMNKDQGKEPPKADTVEKPPAAKAPAKETPPVKAHVESTPPADGKVEVPGFGTPKRDAVDIEEDVPAVIKSGKAAEEWKRMKATHKTELASYQDRIKALESEVSKVKPAAASPDLDVIKKENEQLSEIVRALNVQAHPKFKEYFDSKINGVLEMAKKVGGAHGDQLARVLQIPDVEIRNERLQALFEELPTASQMQVGALAVQLEQINAEKAMEISKAKENYSRITQQNQAQAEASKAKALELFNESLKSVTDPKSGLSVFQTREGDAEWNNGVEQRKRMAQEIFAGDMEVDHLARAAIWASAAPAFLQNLVTYAEENQKLKAQIAELQSGAPTTEETPGGDAPPPSGSRSATYEEGLLERARAINFQ